MAKRVERRTYGVDVAKGWLDIYEAATGERFRIDNDERSVLAWLAGLSGPAELAVEATNRFHASVVACAHAKGHAVYIIDALRLSRYRDAIGARAKTDQHDAQLLARYLQQEQPHLRRWKPQDPRHGELWTLLKRRATLVKTTVQLRQSLSDLGALDEPAKALIAQCQQLIRQVERRVQTLARQVGWSEDLQRARSIPGVGELTVLLHGSLRTALLPQSGRRPLAWKEASAYCRANVIRSLSMHPAMEIRRHADQPSRQRASAGFGRLADGPTRVQEQLHPGPGFRPVIGIPRVADAARHTLGVRHHDRDPSVGSRQRTQPAG